ncbi:MAG TPA: AI-2E family transporter YdiK [Nitrospiria bacterium]|nr:AI-2E family transporter YdiK [Nitrospiria bacterium]
MMPDTRRDLTRTVLAVLFIGLLIGLSLWILRPFLAAIVWAAMIVVATWPMMRAVQSRVGGKRSWAVVVMTLVLSLILILPFPAAIATLVVNAGDMADWAKSITTFKFPPPPDWLTALPLVGDAIAQGWEMLSARGIDEWAREAAPYAGALGKWFAAQVGSIGLLFVEFVMTIVIAAILYANGEYAADLVLRFGRRLAGANGETAVRLAAQAIRGVALGVVVTALVQSVLGGIGLAVAGVPYAIVLTVLMFILSVAQIGAVPVLIPAVIWLYWTGRTGWGTFLLIVTIVVGTLDNFLRPILIKKGANLPLLLVFTGVIGGLVSFGMVGIFIGPVVLAVMYTLLLAWIEDQAQGPEPDETIDAGGGKEDDRRREKS